MLDFAKFKDKVKPIHAEGHVCLDLTDPLTGKVKERVKGDNHVYTDALLCGASFNWVSAVSRALLCLNSYTGDIDTTLPYLLGQTIGYGKPSNAGSGTRRGAYNSVNQVLEDRTTNFDRIRWKFQYDFTTAQCNGEQIGCIGLTNQYLSANPDQKHVSNLTYPTESNYYTLINDGRYIYSCSSAGIITKYDIFKGISTTIDVSSIVGTTSGSNKYVGYGPSNGKYYIYVYNSTASLRKMYVFDNSSFSAATATYSPTNIALSGYGFFVYGTTMFLTISGSPAVQSADFVSNTVNAPINLIYNNAATSEGVTSSLINAYYGHLPLSSTLVALNAGRDSGNPAWLFDLSTASQVAEMSSVNNSGTTSVFLDPYLSEKIIMALSSAGAYCKPAISCYKLPTPITKTSANGMTATYELEVFWE